MHSTKKALIHYLGFLKESGFLFVEGDTSAAAPALSPADRPAQGVPPPMTPRIPKLPAPAQARAVAAIKPASGKPAAGPPLSIEERLARLAGATARAEACRACPLGAARNKLVYGDGSPQARIMFVGEAPGNTENATGLPFVGQAGKLLGKMIEAIGFKREEVYICNTIKCHPPINRDPFPAEKAACEPFLLEQIEIIRPQILVALGAHAAQYLCRSEETIGRLRGRWRDYHGVALLATYHPAFLLRNGTYKPESWVDFQMIHARYSELNPDDPRKIWSKKEPAP
jgi:DNA polymerase